jgi:methyl-accepting chemotaxis protein
MKAKASNLTVKTRLRLLLAMSLALAAIIAGFSYFALTRAQKIAELQMKERLLQGEKSRLELTVRSFAESLAKAMATVPDHQEQIALVRRAVGDIRFQEDKSGYYFLYEGTVARVVGPNPAIEGKDLREQGRCQWRPFCPGAGEQGRAGWRIC